MVEAQSQLEVDFVESSPVWRGCQGALEMALAAAARHEGRGGVVSVLLGDDIAVAALNKQFRSKDGPTNVLSFPAASAVDPSFLGDIALAAETIVQEANFQGKRFEHHAVHLAVHGFLHLLGYDHEQPDQAEAMEARERAILRSVGIEDPYA